MTRFKFAMIAAAIMLTIAPAFVHAQPNPSESVDLAEYQGSFEGRDVQMENSVLTYYREGMQNSVELGYIGNDRFKIVIPPGAQVQSRDGHAIPEFQFNRDEEGNVVSLSFYAPSGELMATHPKTKDLRSVEEESNVQ